MLSVLGLYASEWHGQIYSGIYSCSLRYSREFLVLFLLLFPLNLIRVIKGEYLTLWL